MSHAGLPRGEFELIDPRTGGIVLYERGGGRLEFIVPPVPACGYLYLEVKPVRQRSMPGCDAGWDERQLTLHFESYALQFHAAGGMCRWHDRARSMQWCSNQVDLPLGACLWASDSRGTIPARAGARKDSRTRHARVRESATLVVPHIGPLRLQVAIEATCPLLPGSKSSSGPAPRYRTTFTVYRGQRDLYVEIEPLGRWPQRSGQAAYGFFPLYGSEPWIAVDRGTDLFVPATDLRTRPPAAGMTVARGVRVECDHAGVNFYPLDTSLIGFGGPAETRFDPERTFKDSVLYATLSDSSARPRPTLRSFEFVLQPTGNDEWDGGLAKGGRELFRPLVGTVVKGWAGNVSCSLLRIETDLVHLVTMKHDEDSGGTVLRLWSADPDPLAAKLVLPLAQRGDCLHVCDSLGQPTGQRIGVDRHGRAEVPMQAHQAMMLLLRGKD